MTTIENSILTEALIIKITTAIEVSHIPIDRIMPYCDIMHSQYYSWLGKGEILSKLNVDNMTEHQRLCKKLYEGVESAMKHRENFMIEKMSNLLDDLKRGNSCLLD